MTKQTTLEGGEWMKKLIAKLDGFYERSKPDTAKGAEMSIVFADAFLDAWPAIRDALSDAPRTEPCGGMGSDDTASKPQSHAPQEPVAQEGLIEAFRNADEKDWEHLYGFIPQSGHGQFWLAVFREVREAISTDAEINAAYNWRKR